jgi:hypothetical protein
MFGRSTQETTHTDRAGLTCSGSRNHEVIAPLTRCNGADRTMLLQRPSLRHGSRKYPGDNSQDGSNLIPGQVEEDTAPGTALTMVRWRGMEGVIWPKCALADPQGGGR